MIKQYPCALLFLLTPGCFSLDLAQDPPSKQQYLLSAVPDPAGDGAAAAVEAAATGLPPLQVSKAFVAAPFHERSLVYRIGENQYTTDYYQEFLVSPAQMITRLTVDWLRATGSWPGAEHGGTTTEGYVLDLTVLELYGDYRKADSQQAVLRLRAKLSALDPEDDSQRTLLEKDYDARVDIEDRQGSSLVAGMNRALVEVLDKLAKALRDQRQAGA